MRILGQLTRRVRNKHMGMLTHVPRQERPTLDEIREKLVAIEDRLQNNPELSSFTKTKLINLAQELSEFELGRFLIANDGALSGWWTYYCIEGYKHKRGIHTLERALLEVPVVAATQERFEIFQAQLHKVFIDNPCKSRTICAASIPGGIAADMLTLTPAPHHARFVSIDLDDSVAELTQQLARQSESIVPLEIRCEDAWALSARQEFDVVTSHGLNIYVQDRAKVVALYRSILRSLKSGGVLITSTLTPPPAKTQNCEWNFPEINLLGLELQTEIFSNILAAKWANFCSTLEMIAILKEAGLEKIEVIPDSRNMFPSFVGIKK